ncbi:MAG: GNAT family N-acetyltransferase [Tistlia sp.]|uniref:GNAT family N-acetyltransferase n=1 Tax=Tistlia sp. TaxID=3057121 RepID=UPI0034A35D28
MNRSYATSRVASIADLTADEREAWDEACRSNAALRSPFFSPRFAQGVTEAALNEVKVLVVREGGAPAAFLPFQLRQGWQGNAGIAERVGGEFSDYFGLVASEGLRLGIDEAAARAGPNCLLYSHLPESQVARGFPADNPEPGLMIRIEGGSSAFLERFREEKKKLASNLARCRRNLERDFGPLRFEFDTADKTGRLAFLLDRKVEQYRRTGVYDQLAVPEAGFRRLLSRFLEAPTASCMPLLSELFAGDTWVASHYGLRCGEVLHYWFPVYNPDLRKHAPGSLLLLSVIEAADEEGLALIDRGAGKTKMKEDFSNHEHRLYQGVWSRRSLGGQFAQGLLRLRWKVRQSPLQALARA